MSKKARKKPEPYFYSGAHESENATEKEETEDPYDAEQRENMLDEDELTAAEAGFMRGHEQETPSKKETRKKAVSHDDSISVELAKEDSEDD